MRSLLHIKVREMDPDGFSLFNLDGLLQIEIVGVESHSKVWRGQNSIGFILPFWSFGGTFENHANDNET